MLTRDALMSALPQQTTVELTKGPLAGQSITVRTLPVASFIAWQRAAQNGDDLAAGVLIVEGVVEPKLTRDDAKRLVREIDPETVTEILTAINRWNGWGAPEAPAADTEAGEAEAEFPAAA